jgi:hypothetical protein
VRDYRRGSESLMILMPSVFIFRCYADPSVIIVGFRGWRLAADAEKKQRPRHTQEAGLAEDVKLFNTGFPEAAAERKTPATTSAAGLGSWKG